MTQQNANSGDGSPLPSTHSGSQRVIALLDAKDGIVRSFGAGVYAGNFPPPPEGGGFNFGQSNPRIDLDNGKTVWGCECWWGPEEKMKAKYPDDWKWEDVDIDEHRAANDQDHGHLPAKGDDE